ncbi:hypothetical protein ACFPAF_16545 [Hymenobacter endophyticus]|uniref:YtxH domain-containing protein n=1 Tax=Hymenobacter endophyticus TaxID=3076335 RepID=A0ABU3TKW5_9BACT|nr:hypothetical protein [Hymenobacter endophyticus]MDU0372014.1 hypothetical protein [Hymenobacter endophyticus]
MAKKITPPVKTEASSTDKADKWYEKPLNLAALVLGLIASLFGAGYGAATYKIGVEQAMLNLRREQECNERVNLEKEKCAEYRQSVQAEKMENLVKTIESLQTVSKK